MGGPINYRIAPGQTIVAGDVRATPETQVLTVRLPFGAFVWNRPSTVVVERRGRTERVPIVDVTRVAQIGLWACALAALVASRRWPR